MKLLTSVLIITALGITSIGHASGFDPKKALSKMRSISSWVLSTEGVSGINLAPCPSQADPSGIESPSAYCIFVNTETEEGYRNLLKMLPPGSNLDGVFILIERPDMGGCGR